MMMMMMMMIFSPSTATLDDTQDSRVALHLHTNPIVRHKHISPKLSEIAIAHRCFTFAQLHFGIDNDKHG